MTKQLTAEQEGILLAFEAACESHDLNAFGNGRRFRAHREVVITHARVVSAGLESALTANEKAMAARSDQYIRES